MSAIAISSLNPVFSLPPVEGIAGQYDGKLGVFRLQLLSWLDYLNFSSIIHVLSVGQTLGTGPSY